MSVTAAVLLLFPVLLIPVLLILLLLFLLLLLVLLLLLLLLPATGPLLALLARTRCQQGQGGQHSTEPADEVTSMIHAPKIDVRLRLRRHGVPGATPGTTPLTLARERAPQSGQPPEE